MNNEITIQDLDRDKIAIANTIVSLTYQGYVVNKAKYNKLSFNNLLTTMFKNIMLFNEQQREKLMLMYNKYITLYGR